MNSSNHPSVTINTEIKALLMLVLLKGGTGVEEIQTALKMAALSNLHCHEQKFESLPDASTPQAGRADDDRTLHRLTPKQVVRNSHLAPIKGYAA